MKITIKAIIVVTLLVTITALAQLKAKRSSVIVAWDEVTQVHKTDVFYLSTEDRPAQAVTISRTQKVAGYKVYQGGKSRHYTNSYNAGIATQLTIPDLTPGATYYFAVTSYTTEGVSSDYSAEITYTVPK